MMPLLKVSGLSVERRQDVSHRPRKVLLNIDCSVAAGEVVMLIGPNGAGKSTLLSTMAGDLPPASGQVCFDGRPLPTWTALDLARRRAVLPQRAGLALPFKVDEVVRLGCMARTDSRSALADIVACALNAAGVSHLASRGMPSLSGGEQARVHLARVLAQAWPQAGADSSSSRLLLLDEPCANLDPHYQHAVCETVRRFAHETGAGVVVTMHDLNLAAQYADRILALKQGRLLAEGRPAAVLSRSFVQACFGVDAVYLETGQGLLVATRSLVHAKAELASPRR